MGQGRMVGPVSVGLAAPGQTICELYENLRVLLQKVPQAFRCAIVV